MIAEQETDVMVVVHEINIREVVSEPNRRRRFKSKFARIASWLWHKYNGECYWCGRAAIPPTKDHLIPKCRGGSNKRSNLVLSCLECNVKKADMMPDEYREFLKAKPQ